MLATNTAESGHKCRVGDIVELVCRYRNLIDRVGLANNFSPVFIMFQFSRQNNY